MLDFVKRIYWKVVLFFMSRFYRLKDALRTYGFPGILFGSVRRRIDHLNKDAKQDREFIDTLQGIIEYQGAQVAKKTTKKPARKSRKKAKA